MSLAVILKEKYQMYWGKCLSIDLIILTHLWAVASIFKISDDNIIWFLDSAKIAEISLAYSILLTSKKAIY